MSTETIENTFNVTTPANLKLSNIRGSVTVQTGDEGVISVTALKHLNSGNGDKTTIEMSQGDDGTVSVKTRFPDIALGFLRSSKVCKVDYIARVPKSCSLKLSCVSSDATVEGLEGKQRLSTVSGSMDLNGLTGELDINAVSGDIKGVKLSGPLELDTVSGDVILKDASLPSADCSTVSGDVDIQTSLGDGPYKFNSVSGDVNLIVPADAQCSATVSSISGSVVSKLPKTSEIRKAGTHRVEIQGGGARVKLNSVSGDLRIGPSKDVKIEAQTVESEVEPQVEPLEEPQEESSPKPTRADILDKIERGEISVEEGIEALRS
jgi:DUF4097 and DUF4098 domain-containing protein YvlB